MNTAKVCAIRARIVLADLTHCGTVANADTFPLGIGCVAAYARKHLGDVIDVDLFKFPDDLDRSQSESTGCLWHYNHSECQFIQRVRQACPERYLNTVIVMGGPNISITAEGRRKFLRIVPGSLRSLKARRASLTWMNYLKTVSTRRHSRRARWFDQHLVFERCHRRSGTQNYRLHDSPIALPYGGDGQVL